MVCNILQKEFQKNMVTDNTYKAQVLRPYVVLSDYVV